ncbi:MAG: hypothetical protein JW735_07370 [Prolixibacteraceae bacterium]|nr:hypothetical protein [Prolixibacteraceae bacterium]
MTIAILIIYLITLIFIAITSNKRVNNFSDFFVAGKKGSYFAITGSLLATILGGSAVIGSIDAGKTMGWASSWFMLSASVGLLALIPFTSKISKTGRFTLPELLEDIYNTQTKNIASAIIPLAWLGVVAAQIIAAAKILQSFTGTTYETGVIISGLVFVFYTVAGGQISILKTDSIQAVLIVAGLFTIAAFVFTGNKPIPLQSALSFPFNYNFKPIDLVVLLITYGTTFTVGPDMFSRIFCARNQQVARKAIVTTAIILIPVAFAIGYLSIVPTSSHGAHIINISMELLPAWLSPLVVIALLSAVLSSADTTLLSASIIVTDIFEKNNFNAKSLIKTRVVIIAIGFASIAIAFFFDSIIEMLLVALTVYSGAFTIPIIIGLAGLKCKANYISFAIVTGGLIALSGKLISFTNANINSNLLIVASFFISSLIVTFGALKYKKEQTHNLK